MEYRTVSTKLPSNEIALLRAHCEKKGVTPAYLIRELILREMKITLPHKIAGRNKIFYNRETDSFSWAIELDDGNEIEVLKNVAPDFMEDFGRIIKIGLDERNSYLKKKRRNSVPVPSEFVR